MSKAVVLIAEGDAGLRRAIAEPLLGLGHAVFEASGRSGILETLRGRDVDLVLFGSSRDGTWDGLQLAREIRRTDRTLPIFLIAEHSSEDLAVSALRVGIRDYFRAPWSLDELVASIARCLAEVEGEAPRGAREAGDLLDGIRMIGDSRAACAIRAQIARVAATDSTVLITGETGTGKELVSELVHRNSRRCHQPFVAINCAAIPDSLLESELFGYERGAFTGAHAPRDGKLKLAEGGTVLFDEVADMSPYAQAKVLRVIETKEVYRLGGSRTVSLDVRVIAATNQDLEPLVASGKFRKDLYFRLNVVRIHLAPLRERRQDIPALVDHCVRDLNRRLGARITGIAVAALDALVHYDWPGNVRELKNLLEAVAVARPAGKIFRASLPEHVQRTPRAPESAPDGASERDRLLSALFRTNWNKCEAARELRWSRMTLYRKMARYQISRSDGRLGAEPGRVAAAPGQRGDPGWTRAERSAPGPATI